MKKLFFVLAILFIGIMLVGCTSQSMAHVATPAPTVGPTTVVGTPNCHTNQGNYCWCREHDCEYDGHPDNYADV